MKKFIFSHVSIICCWICSAELFFGFFKWINLTKRVFDVSSNGVVWLWKLRIHLIWKNLTNWHSMHLLHSHILWIWTDCVTKVISFTLSSVHTVVVVCVCNKWDLLYQMKKKKRSNVLNFMCTNIQMAALHLNLSIFSFSVENKRIGSIALDWTTMRHLRSHVVVNRFCVSFHLLCREIICSVFVSMILLLWLLLYPKLNHLFTTESLLFVALLHLKIMHINLSRHCEPLKHTREIGSSIL